MTDRIDYDARGCLDDIVVEDVKMFRMEWMGNNSVWICCYREGKGDVVFWLNSAKKISGTHENWPAEGSSADKPEEPR